MLQLFIMQSLKGLLSKFPLHFSYEKVGETQVDKFYLTIGL